MRTYSKQQFGKELLEELDKGFNITRIARWAFSVRLEHCREFETGLDDVVMSVVAMEEGPEFEYSESELRSMAVDLCGK